MESTDTCNKFTILYEPVKESELALNPSGKKNTMYIVFFVFNKEALVMERSM